MAAKLMMAVSHRLGDSALFLCKCCSHLHLMTANGLGDRGWAEKVSRLTAQQDTTLVVVTLWNWDATVVVGQSQKGSGSHF